MSKKSTKIIATAGVVAGLGVAALPAMTFATGTVVKGQAEIRAEVNEAIAMTITGNEDTSWIVDDTVAEEDQITVNGDSVFTPSGAAQIGAYNTANGLAYDSSNIQLYSASRVSLLPNAAVHGTDGTVTNSNYDGTGFKSAITVYTNAVAGYTLALEDADAITALELKNAGGTSTLDTIPTGTSVTAGTAAWGYSLESNLETRGSTYTTIKVNGSADTIVANGSMFNTTTGAGETTDVYYGVSTKPNQQNGVYKDVIVYTATTK